jgi:hypothetical protein
MGAATLVTTSSAASDRLLQDLGEARAERAPAQDRLAAALGHELADRLVAILSEPHLRRLEAALSPEFAARITSLLAEERGEQTG